jgi:hypothetical protein
MSSEARRVSDPIPILINIDSEPDARETTPGSAKPWVGFERCFDFVAAQRAKMAQRIGAPVHFTWFWRVDPQVKLTYGSADWALRAYAPQIAHLRACGDEIGVHVHVWRWNAERARWVADYSDQAWIEGCIRDGVADFERALGMPAELFSMGDGWHNQRSVRLIEQLGVRIDCTLEPGCEGHSLAPGEFSVGDVPDRRTMPTAPYRPSQSNFLVPGEPGGHSVVLFPMSTAVEPQRRSWRSLFRKRGKPTIGKMHLGHHPGRFGPMFEEVISRRPRPHVVIAARSDLARHESLLRFAEQNLDWMLNHRLAGRFVFAGPAQALALMES